MLLWLVMSTCDMKNMMRCAPFEEVSGPGTGWLLCCICPPRNLVSGEIRSRVGTTYLATVAVRVSSANLSAKNALQKRKACYSESICRRAKGRQDKRGRTQKGEFLYWNCVMGLKRGMQLLLSPECPGVALCK